LNPIQCVGLNLYKIVEMYKNYRPNVPIEYHSDLMYVKLSEAVWSKVKVEKTEGLEFRANLKAKKYAGKSTLKALHLAMVRLRCRWVAFFSRQGFFPH
jgi:hypothetical protein